MVEIDYTASCLRLLFSRLGNDLNKCDLILSLAIEVQTKWSCEYVLFTSLQNKQLLHIKQDYRRMLFTRVFCWNELKISPGISHEISCRLRTAHFNYAQTTSNNHVEKC